MKYYQRHIGDYSTATRHLTMLEHGAYTILLDLCYSTEQPLPLDQSRLFRLAMASTNEEQQAVASVLEEFFTRTETGWRNGRCDHEIAQYQQMREGGRRGAEKRWSAMAAPVASDALPNGVAIGGRWGGHQNPNANQEPITNNQTTNSQKKRRAPPSFDVASVAGLDSTAFQRWQDYRQSIGKPLKAASVAAAAQGLAAFGHEQAAVVHQSIANGWKGLFQVKGQQARPLVPGSDPKPTMRGPDGKVTPEYDAWAKRNVAG